MNLLNKVEKSTFGFTIKWFKLTLQIELFIRGTDQKRTAALAKWLEPHRPFEGQGRIGGQTQGTAPRKDRVCFLFARMVSSKLAVALACAAVPLAGAFLPAPAGGASVAELASSRSFTCPVSRPAVVPRTRGGALGLVADGAGMEKSGVSRRELLGVVLLGAMALPAAAGAQDEIAEEVEEAVAAVAPAPRPRAGAEMQTAEMGADVLDRKEFRQPPQPQSPSTACVHMPPDRPLRFVALLCEIVTLDGGPVCTGVGRTSSPRRRCPSRMGWVTSSCR